MMDQSCHLSVDMLHGYVRAAELFKEHTVSGRSPGLCPLLPVIVYFLCCTA
jgi:hypothetical protein